MRSSLLLLCLIAVAIGQKQCTGTPNQLPVSTKDPVFVSKNDHGQLFTIGEVEPKTWFLHVYGTPYEMGYAHGSLLSQQINALYPQVDVYAEQQVMQYLSDLPVYFQQLIAQAGVNAALDMTYFLTRDYISQEWKQELQGLADGAGLEYMQVIRWHMLPELIKASCSMYGAWGPAISKTNGTLYQLRALDWAMDGPFQQFPAVIVYHPTGGNGHNFSIVTWTGFAAAITGFSSSPLGICEKVWIHYNGTSSRSGIPFHFLLRDILQYDRTIDDGLNRIINAHRTCSIFVGLGDGLSNEFRAVEYSYERVNVYSDLDYPEYPAHPRMKGLVYINKHTQPSEDTCMTQVLQQHYGNLDAITAVKYVTALTESGDTHIAVYDYANQYMYISNASPWINGAATPAYNRPFTMLKMAQEFVRSL
eukprot:TRINITY_DN12738_c0_g1_i1.p1 TRINITY_DN12738_c0_g1~~TRINITY_DN12738_c0_g1_i1.p1  ORF type:complete len:419 (-),score=78.89 TRINITY_DN12738_c0_g1_i1:50-1306(-)